MKKMYLTLSLLCLFAISSFAQVEVSPRLADVLARSSATDYIRTLVFLDDQVDILGLDEQLYAENASQQRRIELVQNALQQKAEATQGPLRARFAELYDAKKIFQYRAYWISNMFFIEAVPEVIYELMGNSRVAILDLDDVLETDEHIVEGPAPDESVAGSEAGLKIINADKLWKMGFTGQGRMVMNIDTGVHLAHPALSSKWRGNNGSPWYHTWFDPISPTSTAPFDCGSHGTHTMGIMTGMVPGDTVGVAPDAHWIAAGVTDCPGASYPSMNIAAFQWAMNPDSNVTTISDMPDVINCSWRDPYATDECTGIYVQTLSAVEAVGIAVVFSAGNSGPGSSTITAPKNINVDEVSVMCVGSIDGALYLGGSTNPISSFSSRGPSKCGGTGSLLIKPEVSAPGANVRSSVPTGYANNSGTSMAAPHVAGAVALLKSFVPTLTGKQIKMALYQTAKDLGTVGEDNTYGMGLIDIYAAYQLIASQLSPLSPFVVNSPAAGSTLTSFPNSTASFPFAWDTASIGATYKWIFGTTSNPRMIVVNANNNSLSLNVGQLDNLLGGLGVLAGDSIVGQWDVWAYRNNPPDFDSLKSSNGPRAITLKRGIPDLVAFNLNIPANNTSIITSVFNNTTINFKWTKSGVGTTYKLKFGQNFSEPILNISTGFDTVFSVTNAGLDLLLHNAGVQQSQSVAGQWAVWAYNGATDSLKSAESFNLTLQRQARGDFLVAYDSTAANGRISKDSIVAALGFLGHTYDLWNKGTITSANSISFRGYNGLIWLGTATSVMSNVQRDSVKSFLISGTPNKMAHLVIFSEDFGYQHGRSSSSYLDLDMMNNYLGATFELDRPGSTGNHGMIGQSPYFSGTDSTVGSWPDVFGIFDNINAVATHRYRFDNSIHGVARTMPGYTTQLFGTDAHAMRNAPDSPNPGLGPVTRRLMSVIQFVPVEFVSFSTNVSSNVVSLFWTTATEVNNKGFEVERRNETSGFVSVGFIEGKGTTTDMQDYSFTERNLAVGSYVYRLKQIDFDGTTSYSDEINVEVSVPLVYSLSQNYPNPFNPVTKIEFSLANQSSVTLRVFDILGQQVSVFSNPDMKSGYHSYSFDGAKISSGIYFYQLEAEGIDGTKFSSIKKMVLMK
jgi:subtilisin family serine protease